MISKPVYDLIPAVYLIIGSVSMTFVDRPLVMFFGFILYTLAAYILIMRSNYRRQDKPARRMPYKLILLPEALYEYIPYLYLACALILTQITTYVSVTLLSCVLIAKAAQILFLRRDNRTKTRMLSSELKTHTNR